jgi:hypothetical protein
MLAIRRGVIGGYAIPSPAELAPCGDLILFSLVLFVHLFRRIRPDAQTVWRASANCPASARIYSVRTVKEPCGLRQRSPTLDEEPVPRICSPRSGRYRPDHLQPLNHRLLGWRHLQLAPCSLRPQRPRWNSDGPAGDDPVPALMSRSFHPAPHRSEPSASLTPSPVASF